MQSQAIFVAQEQTRKALMTLTATSLRSETTQAAADARELIQEVGAYLSAALEELHTAAAAAHLSA